MMSDQEIIGLHAMEYEARNFYLTESHYPPNMKIPKHSHENASLYFILRGGMTEKCDNVTRERVPSSLVYTPPGQAHSNHIEKTGCRLFMVEMKADWLAAISEFSNLPSATFQLDYGLATTLARRTRSEASFDDPFASLVIEGLILELIAEISRHQTKPKRMEVAWLKKAEDLLRSRFATKVSIEEVARELGLHPIYFVSAFRRHYRCTVGEYIRHLRVEYACSQLRCSNASLTEIALAAGFFDQSHFSRTFKLQIGTTPAKYRAMCAA
jgi:AraC family transcriptional regulator